LAVCKGAQSSSGFCILSLRTQTVWVCEMFIVCRKTEKSETRTSVMALMVNRHMFEHGRQKRKMTTEKRIKGIREDFKNNKLSKNEKKNRARNSGEHGKGS
jgi:hypothetical protein